MLKLLKACMKFYLLPSDFGLSFMHHLHGEV